MSNAPYSREAMRRGTWRFLTGKVTSALLTVVILLWLVRLMTVAEYGAYVVLVAGMELGFALAGFGLPWLAARYLPEYRLHGSGASLTAICRQLLLWQVMSLLACITLLAIMLNSYLSWTGLELIHTPAQIYLLVLLVEGLGRFLRVALMDPLMLQGESRSSMILRQLSFLILISALDFTDHGTLLWVVSAELVASTFGMLAALILLWRHLQGLRDQVCQQGWSAPMFSAQRHIAGRMYATQLLTLAYSPQVFLNLIQHTLGVESAALFGFLSNLQRQIAQYLPATLLFSIIRPKMVADYVGGGGMAELSRNTNLAGKLSLFVLMPLVALVALAGEPLIAWLSGSKFIDSGWLLLGLMLTLIPYSQWQLNQSLAVVSGHVGLCTWAAASGLIVLPLMWILLQLNLGLWAAIIATGLGNVLLNTIVVVGVSKWAGYQADWIGFLKLTFSALAAYGISMMLHIEGFEFNASIWLLAAFQCLTFLLIYFMISCWVKSFAVDERARINALAKYRIFIW